MHCYPCKEDPIQLQKASGVWADFATPVEIIPFDTIDTRFSIVLLSVSDISATGAYQVRLYFGAEGEERELMTIPFSGNIAVFTNAIIRDGHRVMPENTRISAALSSSNIATNTIGLTLGYDCIPENC